MTKLITSDMPEFCINYYIKGLEQCYFQVNEIEIEDSDYFSKLIINQNEKRCYATIYFKKGVYNSGNDEEKWKKQGENIIRKLAVKLIEEGFSVFHLCIEQGDASFPPSKNGNKGSMHFSFKIAKSSNKERKIVSKNIILSDETDITEEQKLILIAMQIADEAWRYETLYELLKNKCGKYQSDVRKVIEKKYAQKYDIYMQNENKDSEKHEQDDLTYLRTICAHLNPKSNDFEKYEKEYNKRIKSHTHKLIRILFEEYC